VIAWNLSSYRRPFLAADKVTRAGDYVLIERAGETFELSIEGGGITDTLAALQRFQRPGDPLWEDALRDPNHVWRDLLEQLDTLTLLRDDETSVTAEAAAESKQIDGDAHALAEWLKAASVAAPARQVQKLARQVLEAAVAAGTGEFPEQDRPRSGRFIHDLLMRMVRLWRRTSPLSLSALSLALTEFLEEVGENSGTRGWKTRWNGWRAEAGGVFEPADVRLHLQTAGALMGLAAAGDDQRICTLPARSSGHVSGTNLMLEAEWLAVGALRQLGSSSFHEALEQGLTSRKLAAGIYVEQYHLSRRFVEILGPMQMRRLRSDLRDLVFHYYAEEVGHEEFEQEAAMCLGVTDDEISRSLALPFFAAYLELLTDIADVNPVGLLLCILVTEGFPGTRTPINAALQRAGLAPRSEVVTRHEAVNVDLHHSTIPRVMLSKVPLVGSEERWTALADLITMIELNSRGWQMLYGYYGSGETAFPHSWMTLTPQLLPAMSFGRPGATTAKRARHSSSRA
jgi:hypothetical protein